MRKYGTESDIRRYVKSAILVIDIVTPNVSGYIMRIPERMLAMRKYIASRDRDVNTLAHIKSKIAIVRVEIIVERLSAMAVSAKVIPAKVSPPNPRSATNPRRSEALCTIRSERSANTQNPVMKSIPILCHPSAMNPMKLSKNAIAPNTTIEATDIRDWNVSQIPIPRSTTIESGTIRYDDVTKVEANSTMYPAINTGIRDS